MALVGTRYRPDLAIVSRATARSRWVPTMPPYACKLSAPAQAIPVHYAHNPLVVGTQCGDLFRAAAARVAPGMAVTVMHPGQTTTLQVAALQR